MRAACVAASALAGHATSSVDDLGFGKKKKKKKAKEGGGDGAGDDAAAADEAGGLDGDGGELDELKLKKKKKKKATFADGGAEDGGEADGGGGDGEEEEPSSGGGLPWAGSSRDYHYEELLGRVFGILRENNPELSGEKHKTILKPPQVLREGTKKTVFVNFPDLCKAMHRSPEHVIAYLLTELGTSGNLDGQARLIVKGRFLPKVFEGILRRYINDYVICNMCKSADTLLHKENRLFILRCQAVRTASHARHAGLALLWLRSLVWFCGSYTHHRFSCLAVRRLSQRVCHQVRLRRPRGPPQAGAMNTDQLSELKRVAIARCPGLRTRPAMQADTDTQRHAPFLVSPYSLAHQPS
jgi:translation initiation factor 2 subunit 2